MALSCSRLVKKDHAHGGVVELSNGCICCSLSSNMEESVWDILQGADGLDMAQYIVIETSGVADPGN